MSPRISLNIFVYFPKSERNHLLRSASPRQEDHPRDHSPLPIQNVQSGEEGRRLPLFSRVDWPWETGLRHLPLWSKENWIPHAGPFAWLFVSCSLSILTSQLWTRLVWSLPPALSPPPPQSLNQTRASFEATDCVFKFIHKCFSNVYPKEGADFSWNMDQFCTSQTSLALSNI